ncbi:unnamed protein product [Durusdinium trenchii]|uniref:C3H1-type domain-containing protein n=1 Tax=Durusdinium trenchii TaxID=1381693 RepID=A0ABP0SIR4_9DINO
MKTDTAPEPFLDLDSSCFPSSPSFTLGELFGAMEEKYEIQVKHTFIHFGAPQEEFKRCSSWSMGDPTDLENAFSLPITGGLPGRVGSDGTGVSISGGETSTPRGETYSLAKHNAGRCNPCVYFASRRGCAWAQCAFCHYAHDGKGKRPTKQIRDAIKDALKTIVNQQDMAGDPSSKRLALQALAGKDSYVRGLIIGHLDAEIAA